MAKTEVLSRFDRSVHLFRKMVSYGEFGVGLEGLWSTNSFTCKGNDGMCNREVVDLAGGVEHVRRRL